MPCSKAMKCQVKCFERERVKNEPLPTLRVVSKDIKKGPGAMTKKPPCPGVPNVVRGYNANDMKQQPKPRKLGTLMITSRPCTLQNVTLSAKDLERLKAEAQVVTVDKKFEELARQEMEIIVMDREAERARQYFKNVDDARKNKADEQSPEDDQSDDKLKVFERVFLEKHEQEEEVKRVNRIILNAKCHAVRDAQLKQKVEIEKQMQNECRRLEMMVIDNAKEALKKEDDFQDRQSQRRRQYAQDIRAQLVEKENLKFMEAERLEEEARIIREITEAVRRDEARQVQLQKDRRKKFSEDLARIQEMTNVFKKMMCEQEQEHDARIAAYMREKEKREKELKDAEMLAKNTLERKKQRLFALAEKFLQSKSAQDEMSYLREQEKVEREYRRKEKEAAMRKKQLEKEFREARERQMQELKHRKAVLLARDEREFNVLLDILKKEDAKQRQLEAERERQRNCYRRDIMNQMNWNENERRRLAEMELKQAAEWRESERQRDANIRAVIEAKLKAMRDACLPEKYILEVEQQLKRLLPKAKSDKC